MMTFDIVLKISFLYRFYRKGRPEVYTFISYPEKSILPPEKVCVDDVFYPEFNQVKTFVSI